MPARAELPIVFRGGDFQVEVQELGCSGTFEALKGGGTALRCGEHEAFWAGSGTGHEEWLFFANGLSSAHPESPVAQWKISGGTLREQLGAVEVLDDDQRPRLRVTAPTAVSPSGPVQLRLSASAGTLSLSVEGVVVGPLLIDPVWQLAGTMLEPRYNHSATLLLDGRVLVAAGVSNNNSIKSAEIYDPSTNAWLPAAQLSFDRTRAQATRLNNGKVLVAGGLKAGFSDVTLASVELYDPVLNVWTTVAPMQLARQDATATTLTNGKVLVAGGRIQGLNPHATCELYDPTTNSWIAAGSLATARSNHTATLLPNGKVLVVGGIKSGGCAGAELYDPVGNSWQAAGVGPAVCFHTASPLPGGKVLVAGGSATVGSSPNLAATSIYDSTTNTWSAAASMAMARSQHAASSLNSGKVVVLTTGNTYTREAEIYDPTSNTWTAAGETKVTRVFMTATLVAPGRVLIAGGWNGGEPLEFELFDPTGGDSCTSGTTCVSGFCVDGVCCDNGCGGSCDRCNLASKEGICSVAPEGTPGSIACDPYRCDGISASCPVACPSDLSCVATHFCLNATCQPNGSGPVGAACRQNVQCGTGNCADDTCCGTACGDACSSCNQPSLMGTCAPDPAGVADPACGGFRCGAPDAGCLTQCTANTDCATTFFCADGGCTLKRPLGAACEADADCEMNQCAKGVCCGSACNAACTACNLRPPIGSCDVAPLGYAPTGGCGNYLCSGYDTDCPSGCNEDAGCTLGHYCSGARRCLADGTGLLGSPCDAGFDCGSGECTDGVCCNSSCGGTDPTDCQACSVAAGAVANGQCGARAAGTVCRTFVNDGGPPRLCDIPEACDGVGRACPPDAFRPPGTECRASSGLCDVAEACTGTSPFCPALDVRLDAGVACRLAAGDCDVAEACDGVSPTCPIDGFALQGATCRLAGNACDVAEACSGTQVACPTDLKMPDGTICAPAKACTGGSCLGMGGAGGAAGASGAGGAGGSGGGGGGGLSQGGGGGTELDAGIGPTQQRGCGCSAASTWGVLWILSGLLTLGGRARRR